MTTHPETKSLAEYLQASLDTGKSSDLCRGWNYLRTHTTLQIQEIISRSEYWALKYNQSQKDYILKQCGETLTETQERQLGSLVFLLMGKKTQQEEEAYCKKMLEDGWVVLDSQVVQQAVNAKKKIRVKATKTHDWLKETVDSIYKPFVDNKGNCYLMKPRARSRGYGLHTFEKAFCQLV